MAAIRNSISLQDRMSPVFRSIIKSMDSTLRVMRNLDKQANKGIQSKAYRSAERDIKRANNELIRMQNNLSRADKAAGKLATTTGKVSTNMSRMGSGGLNLGNLAAGLYLLKNIANTMSGIMETPDTVRAIQYRLDTYDTSAATGNQLFDAAYLAAQRSRSDVESTANLASRILISGATGGSGAASIDLAEILNKASFLGGSSSQESQRALLQLSQALASGVLQGDELRAIREQAPGLTDILAKGLSSMAERGALPEKFLNTTMGDLKQLGADGELTAQRVISAFQEMGDYVDDTFANSPKQFGQAVTGIANVWKRWLKLMSQGDNALAKINEKAWQLLEWFESTDGMAFMEGLAKGINFIVDGIIQIIDRVGSLISWFKELNNSTQILQSAFMALGILVGITAAKMFVGFVIAQWSILVVLALIGAIIYALLDCGVTTTQIIGSICGAFMFLAYLIYDVVIGAIMALGLAGVGAGMIIILALQAVVQVVMWVVLAIWSAIVTVYDVLYSIVKGAYGVVKGAIVGIYQVFVWLGQGVLGILYGIASAIDFIFGSNLAGTVGGWIDGLGSSVDALNEALDPLGEFEDIGNQWKNSYGTLGDMWAGNGKYKGWNITDDMSDVWNGGTGMMEGIWNWGTGSMANPMNGWNRGYNFGSGLVDDIGNFDFNGAIGDMSSIEEMLNNGVGVDGGNIDSVGSIKSDVDISDQDIQLLRDIAAREFLLNLQTVTPQANVTFGDVRETADVNKILDVIQDMVDEELATSLVVG